MNFFFGHMLAFMADEYKKITGTVKALQSGDATSLRDVAIKTPPTFLCLINDTQYHNVIKYPLGWFIHIVVVVDCIIEKNKNKKN